MCWLAFAKIEKPLDLGVKHGNEIGIQDDSGSVNYILVVMDRIRGARIQQSLRERDEDAFERRTAIGKTIRSSHDLKEEACSAHSVSEGEHSG
jgi:hypothetical protein